MPISHGLTTEQIGQVQSLVNQGHYADAWSQLAAWGDSYADNAADVTGNHTSAYGYVMHELVKQHWENTADPGAYEQHFNEVAGTHLNNYLDLMRNYRNPAPLSVCVRRRKTLREVGNLKIHLEKYRKC